MQRSVNCSPLLRLVLRIVGGAATRLNGAVELRDVINAKESNIPASTAVREKTLSFT